MQLRLQNFSNIRRFRNFKIILIIFLVDNVKQQAKICINSLTAFRALKFFMSFQKGLLFVPLIILVFSVRNISDRQYQCYHL